MKDELGGKIMTTFNRLKAKTYSYFINDGSENKKTKYTRICVMKRKLNFESYKKLFRRKSTGESNILSKKRN